MKQINHNRYWASVLHSAPRIIYYYWWGGIKSFLCVRWRKIYQIRLGGIDGLKRGFCGFRCRKDGKAEKSIKEKWYVTYCNHEIITFVIIGVQLRREPSGGQNTHTFCENRLILCTHLKTSLLVSPKRPIFYIVDIVSPSSPKFACAVPLFGSSGE